MANRTVSSSRFLINPQTYSLKQATGQYVLLGKPALLDVGTMSYAAWINPSMLQTGGAGDLIALGFNYGSNKGRLLKLSTKNELIFLMGNTSKIDSSGKTISPSKWTHIAITYDNTNVRFYIGGVKVSTIALSSVVNDTSANCYIGCESGPGFFFIGSYLKNYLFSRVLSDDDVADLCFRDTYSSTGLIGKWSCNDGSGSTLADSSGNGLNGTITGATFTTNVPPHMKARSSATQRSLVGKAYIDSFNRANGVLGNLESGDAWNHTGWTVASAKANSNPTPLTTIVSNGSFTSNTTGWTAVNSTLASVAGGSSGNCLQITNVGTNMGYAYQAMTTVVGTWYKAEVLSKNGTTTGIYMVGTTISGIEYMNKSTNAAGWTGRAAYFRATTTTTYITLKTGVTTDTLTALYDEVALNPLTLSELMATVQTNYTDFVISCNPTQIQTGGMGIIASVDSYSNPQNFVFIEWINGFGGTARMTKCVNGTYTVLFSVSVSGNTSRPMTLVKNMTSYSFYYNGIQVGTTQTVSDSSIINNTLHGVFSPDTSSTIDNFLIGTGTRSLV